MQMDVVCSDTSLQVGSTLTIYTCLAGRSISANDSFRIKLASTRTDAIVLSRIGKFSVVETEDGFKWEIKRTTGAPRFGNNALFEDEDWTVISAVK